MIREELELKHWQLNPKYILGSGWMELNEANAHTNLSIQFAIDVLEKHIEHPTKPGYERSDILKEIQELTEYLK